MSPLVLFLIAEGALVGFLCCGVVAVLGADFVVRALRRRFDTR